METLTVFKRDGWWMVRSDAARVRELFGTDTLPTPYMAGRPWALVEADLMALNPDKRVVVVRD